MIYFIVADNHWPNFEKKKLNQFETFNNLKAIKFLMLNMYFKEKK